MEQNLLDAKKENVRTCGFIFLLLEVRGQGGGGARL